MREYRLRQREHPLFSPVALVSTFVLVVGLGVGVFMTGGRAFSPGDLSAVGGGGNIQGFESHADFGDDCGRCHTPFQGVEPIRCEECHEDVAEQRRTGDGLHSRFDNPAECGNCHLDHKGSDQDLVLASLPLFDHKVTAFVLAKHGKDYEDNEMPCAACHESEGEFTASNLACSDCHWSYDAEFMKLHSDVFGGECLSCHDGVDTLANYTAEDHAGDFELVGAHSTASCEGCHLGPEFSNTPATCESCHVEPDIHAGTFGLACADCHTAFGWSPAVLDFIPFEHERATRFSLERHAVDFDGSVITCQVCHTDESYQFDEMQCATCHAQAEPTFVANHIFEVGESCLFCHDGRGRLAGFDHETVWPLTGQHATVTCLGCHQEQVSNDAPRECVACHAEPDIHMGLFGTDCSACHTADAWQPARLIRHSFPLDHGESGEVPCATCHPTTYAEYTCYGCHEHEPAETEREHLEENISAPELFDCVECHPTGREHEGAAED